MSPIKDGEFKKTYGAFYTPNKLASELTRRAIEQIISSQIKSQSKTTLSTWHTTQSNDRKVLKAVLSYLPNFTILDGSLGEGEFIITSYNVILEIFNSVSKQLTKLGEGYSSFPQETILNNLFGMEINSGTLSACRRILKRQIQDVNKETLSKWMKNNLLVGNFLNSSFTSWKSLPENFNGFDLIIGNPPWGSQLTTEEKIQHSNKFKLTGSMRNLNSFELFVYQGTDLLKPNVGHMALFLPKNLTRSNQYVSLRKFILQKYQIKSLFFHELFQDVTQEFISIVAQHSENSKAENEILVNDEDPVPQSVYMNNTDYIFTNVTDKSSLRLLNKIKSNTKSLEEYVTIQRGEELSKKGGVMFCTSCKLWVPLSSRKSSVECSQCHEILDKNHLRIEFLISPKKSLQYTLPILTGDDFDHYWIKSSHYFNDTIMFKSKKNSVIYNSPKIVVQKIKQYPCAALDEDNTRTTQNVYNIRLKEQWQEKPNILYYILAILNSRLFKWYYENQFNLGSKYTNAISIKNLKRLPIQPPEENEKILMSLEGRLRTKPNSDRPSDLLLEEIDEIIYHLYDCSSYRKLTQDF